MNQIIAVTAQIKTEYIYSIVSSIMGYTMLYSYAPSKLKFIEFIRNIITVVIVGAVALAVAKSYYPANSDMVNIAVIPFAAGFLMPYTISALAKILQIFSKDPVSGIGLIAKIVTLVKGSIPSDKDDKKGDDNDIS
jgi:hypothetical protein